MSDLWDECERAWSRTVDAVEPAFEREVDAAVLFEIALKCHEAAQLEFERSIAAMQMAVRRAQRAKRLSRRAGLTLIRAARMVAAAKHERKTAVTDALKAGGFR